MESLAWANKQGVQVIVAQDLAEAATRLKLHNMTGKLFRCIRTNPNTKRRNGMIDASFESEVDFAFNTRSCFAYLFKYSYRPLIFLVCRPPSTGLCQLCDWLRHSGPPFHSKAICQMGNSLGHSVRSPVKQPASDQSYSMGSCICLSIRTGRAIALVQSATSFALCIIPLLMATLVCSTSEYSVIGRFVSQRCTP